MPSLDEMRSPASMATVPLGLGEVLAGKYRVDGLLGAGGMGLVLAATQTELDRRVAIKMMREEALRDPDSRARFAREAKAAVRLKSQHVARVLDVGVLDNGAPYLVMEYLDGSDLATVLEEQGPLPVAGAVAYMLQVCEAVAEAHGLGIVHRDLKPRNVFLTRGVDGKPLLKVLDFGISKMVKPPGETADLALTKTTDVMGSPSYMAPEQLRAARHADARSDIWSLGVILFELVTGQMPWAAESTSELCAMVFRDPPRSLRELRPDVPPGLEALVLQCLEKEAAKRFASVEALAHALEPYAMGLATGAAERITSVARTSRFPGAAAPKQTRAESGSSRVLVSGGTSVSWGETEPMGKPPASIVPPPPSRARLVVLAALVVGAGVIATGGWAIARRTHEPQAAAPPVLPEDRGANRPAPTATATATATAAAIDPMPASTSLLAATANAAPPATGAATSLAGIPRRAAPAATAIAPATGGATAIAQTAPTSPTAPATPPPSPVGDKPDPHDIGSIGRK